MFFHICYVFLLFVYNSNFVVNMYVYTCQRIYYFYLPSRSRLDHNILLITSFLHYFQLRLEERERENASLTRQLENALTDIRRQQEQNRDKQAAKVHFRKFNLFI